MNNEVLGMSGHVPNKSIGHMYNWQCFQQRKNTHLKLL